MQTDRRWEVLLKGKAPTKGWSASGWKKELLKILLSNRKIKTKKEIEDFLNPKLEDVTAQSVGIDSKQLANALSRIKKAIKDKEHIVVFGDYDVDGICGTAILWEILNSMGVKVTPYIPHRIDEGYGLSEISIANVKTQIPDVKLIITVDNGIVANGAVAFANKNGIDVIITDHHTLGMELPKALAIVHTTKLCGTGVAWILSQELISRGPVSPSSHATSSVASSLRSLRGTPSGRATPSLDHLELVALATVADLVPLVNANRTLLKFGLEQLRITKRPGLLALFQEAGIDAALIDTYEIGHVISPRINAMGRLENAMDSLRLICTTDKKRAAMLAQTLSSTNRERQMVTEEAVLHAKAHVRDFKLNKGKLLFVVHESYKPGVIGLVAGKLVEEFYRPSIVLSRGEKYSKASARSISGFNIVEFIRQASEFLVDVGGHPMAAGFTVETENLEKLQKRLEEIAEKLLNKESFIRNLRIDTKIPLSFIDTNLMEIIKKLAPFGMANPAPVFLTEKVTVEDMKLVGQEGKHIKFFLSQDKNKLAAIAFGLGEKAPSLHIGDKINIVYSVEDDTWNGNRRLQLKIKDIN